MVKIIFSNRLETLADALRDRLFFSDLSPFEKKTVIVPNLLTKNYLLLRWANDPLLQVATGVKIETLYSFLNLTPKAELSLQIEAEIRKGDYISDYLASGSERRLFSLCDELSSLFQRYLFFGGEEWRKKEGWQKELWKKVGPSWNPKIEGKVFLFHFSFLPPSMASLFAQAEGYFLSPSQMYWGDVFEGQNLVLSNCGKMGRKFLTFLEGEELYEEASGDSFLETVQKEILYLEEREKVVDDSIQIHAAATKMQEVEALRETVLRLGVGSDKVLVLAPDIAEYVPYIHAVFQEGPDYALSNLQIKEESLLAKGIEHLLSLPERDFPIEGVLQLLSFRNFLEKFRLTAEEGHRIGTWVKKIHLRYGFRGLDRLLIALITVPQEGELFLDFTDAPLIAKAVEIFELLTQKLDVQTERTVHQWMHFALDLADTFFVLESEDEILLQEFRKIKGDLTFSYASMRRVFQSILEKKNGFFQAAALHAIRFVSLSAGTAIPAEVICLLGMEDGSFPRREKKSSLCVIEGEWAPSQGDEDRYLFLELLLSARKYFLLFYTKCDPEDGKENEASPVLQDLISLGVPLRDHPPRTYVAEEKKETLFKFEFLEKTTENLSIPLKSLREFARHPLRFYFEKKEGIPFERDENRYPEFSLSNLDLFLLKKQSFDRDVEEIIERAEKKGLLPEGPFSAVAKEKIRTEVGQYRDSLAQLQVQKLETIDVDLHISLPGGRSAHVYGKLEDVTPEGLLVRGEDKLEEWIKIWPLYLIYLQVKREGKVLFLQSQEIKGNFFEDSLVSLQRYLEFFERAQPSPCMPAWGRAFLQKDHVALEKAMDSSFFPDPVVEYLLVNSLLPSAEKLHRYWSPFLKEVFHEIV